MSFHPWRRACIRLLILSLLVGTLANQAGILAFPSRFAAAQSTAPDAGLLSPFWDYKIQRWDTLIVQEGTRRGLDPDFLAALVWMESRGDPDAVGPVGAVGLMQVMPKEAGFSWRPTREALHDPSTNLFWGARTLSTVVHQGKGNIFKALAAYNGGWDQITYRGPRRFATTILRDYATARAQRHGVTERWVAFFAIWDATAHGPIWVADSRRDDVYFYGDANWVPEGTTLIPYQAPTAIVAQCLDETSGRAYAVGLWLYVVEQNWWVGSENNYLQPRVTPTPLMASENYTTPIGTLYPTSTPVLAGTPPLSSTPTGTPTLQPSPSPTATLTMAPSPTPSPSPSMTPTTTATPDDTATTTPTPTATPTPTPSTTAIDADAIVLEGGADLRPGATRWWDPVETLPEGTALSLLGYDPAYADWVYVKPIDGGRAGWTEIANLKLSQDLDDVPPVTPRPTLTPSLTPSPTLTPTPSPTPKPQVACNGEPLFAEAWPMRKFNTEDGGWKAIIFARGHEGTCNYTYAWDDVDNVVGGPTYEPVTFEIYRARRDAPIVGSVIVTDGEETVTVQLHILSPDNDS